MIGRLLRQREHHLGDDLVALQRGREQALEEFFRLQPALVGDDGGAERQHGRRIIRGRIVVGERAADGALVAHRGIADQAGQFGQRRDRLADDRRNWRPRRAWRWRRSPASGPSSRCSSSPSIWERSTRCGGLASRCFMTGSSVWPPAISLGVFVLDQQIGGLPHGRRTVIFEFVHEELPDRRRDEIDWSVTRDRIRPIALAPAAID